MYNKIVMRYKLTRFVSVRPSVSTIVSVTARSVSRMGGVDNFHHVPSHHPPTPLLSSLFSSSPKLGHNSIALLLILYIGSNCSSIFSKNLWLKEKQITHWAPPEPVTPQADVCSSHPPLTKSQPFVITGLSLYLFFGTCISTLVSPSFCFGRVLREEGPDFTCESDGDLGGIVGE